MAISTSNVSPALSAPVRTSGPTSGSVHPSTACAGWSGGVAAGAVGEVGGGGGAAIRAREATLLAPDTHCCRVERRGSRWYSAGGRPGIHVDPESIQGARWAGSALLVAPISGERLV